MILFFFPKLKKIQLPNTQNPSSLLLWFPGFFLALLFFLITSIFFSHPSVLKQPHIGQVDQRDFYVQPLPYAQDTQLWILCLQGPEVHDHLVTEMGLVQPESTRGDCFFWDPAQDHEAPGSRILDSVD